MQRLEAIKIVVVGAGTVGATYCYTLMQTGLANEIVLIDVDTKRLEGEVMDLSHGLPFVRPVIVRGGDYSDCSDASLIVLTAGAKQKRGQSRLELVRENTEIVSSICDRIGDCAEAAVLVVVTNPVDVLTYVAIKRLGWPRGRVMGSGTVLDSSRFRYLLSRHCGIDARNIHAYILGEHGDSEIAAWSMSHIAGLTIDEYCKTCRQCDYVEEHKRIEQQVRDSAYHVIDYKGATYYAIGLSLMRISEAILRNENSVLTVSTLLEGEYGIGDICLGIPCIIGRKGVNSIIQARLSEDEHIALKASAETLQESLTEIHVAGVGHWPHSQPQRT